MNLSNTALITHKNCMDGSACAVLFELAGGKPENVYFSHPGDDNVDAMTKEVMEHWPGPVLLVDVGISEHLAEEIDAWIAGELGRIQLLDHHRSSIPLNEFGWCYVDEKNSQCGAMMFWDWLVSGLRNAAKKERGFGDASKRLVNLQDHKPFIEAVDDRDRWINKNPDAPGVAALHNILKSDMFIERFLNDPDPSLTEHEEYIVGIAEDKKSEYIEAVKEHVRVVEREVDGKKVRVGFVVAHDHQSDLGHNITADPDLNCDIAVMVGSHNVGLRSRDDCPVDLSKIALLNHVAGGGHQHSAGFSLEGVFGKEVIDIITEKMRFE